MIADAILQIHKHHKHIHFERATSELISEIIFHEKNATGIQRLNLALTLVQAFELIKNEQIDENDIMDHKTQRLLAEITNYISSTLINKNLAIDGKAARFSIEQNNKFVEAWWSIHMAFPKQDPRNGFPLKTDNERIQWLIKDLNYGLRIFETIEHHPFIRYYIKHFEDDNVFYSLNNISNRLAIITCMILEGNIEAAFTKLVDLLSSKRQLNYDDEMWVEDYVPIFIYKFRRFAYSKDRILSSSEVQQFREITMKLINDPMKLFHKIVPIGNIGKILMFDPNPNDEFNVLYDQHNYIINEDGCLAPPWAMQIILTKVPVVQCFVYMPTDQNSVHKNEYLITRRLQNFKIDDVGFQMAFNELAMFIITGQIYIPFHLSQEKLDCINKYKQKII
jgi:hypothetical protein